MELFTKSHELGVFLILFVSVVEGIRGDERTRLDADQDPFESVTLADDGGVNSALFASCLAASRTLDVKLYSIEIPASKNEFIRYVPDSWQLSVPPEWTSVASNLSVTKITDCAAAAAGGGNVMFKYSGGSDCKVSNQSFDLKYAPSCGAEAHDAVFISSLAVVRCPLPGIRVAPANGGKVIVRCVTVNTGPMSYADAKNWCSSNGATMFDGPIATFIFDDVVKILKDQKGQICVNGLPVGPLHAVLLHPDFHSAESSNFALDAHFENPTWKWTWENAAVDPALMVAAPSTSADDIVFISGAAGFKLDFAPKGTFMGGVVCQKSYY